MEDNKIIKIAATGFVVFFVAPVVISSVIGAVCAVGDGINNIVHERKIKKGLEDGSIVEVDGKYYEVKPDDK